MNKVDLPISTFHSFISIQEKQQWMRSWRGSVLLVTDHLRFVEAICSDKVRDWYKYCQNMLIRQQLDTSVSATKDKTFHELICEQFNCETWKPYSTAYPNLHPDFVHQILLKKSITHSLPPVQRISFLMLNHCSTRWSTNMRNPVKVQ